MGAGLGEMADLEVGAVPRPQCAVRLKGWRCNRAQSPCGALVWTQVALLQPGLGSPRGCTLAGSAPGSASPLWGPLLWRRLGHSPLVQSPKCLEG